MRKIFGFLLLICAYALLIPGLTQPMLSVSGTVEKIKLVGVGQSIFRENKDIPGFVKDIVAPLIDSVEVTGTVPAFSKTNSILSTAAELYNNNHAPVAAMILFFSVGIPLLKALLLIFAHLPLQTVFKRRLLWVSLITSKWSMADVFVVAIFVAYLAANGLEENRALVDFESNLGHGFYYFFAYCVLSIIATQILSGTVSLSNKNLSNKNLSDKNLSENN